MTSIDEQIAAAYAVIDDLNAIAARLREALASVESAVNEHQTRDHDEH